MQNGLFMLVGICTLIALLPIEIFLGMRMKKRAMQLEIPISPLFTYMNVLSIFMYACMLSGCMEFIYFAYIDKGELFTAINTMLTSPDTQALYRQAGMTDYYKQAIAMIQELEYLSPFDKTMLLFNNSFVTSIILSILISVVTYFYKPATLK